MLNSDETGNALLQIAVLAAGASSRMRGRDKLLETIGGVPVLRIVLQRALATEFPCCVTLPVGGSRWDAIADLGGTRLPVADAAEGMAASFRAAGSHAGARAVMTLLADMPEIETGDMARVVDIWREAPARVTRGASEDGVPGQPVILPARLVPRLQDLVGDTGARGLIAGEDVRLVPLPGRRAITDLDTPEDWADWRARTGIMD